MRATQSTSLGVLALLASMAGYTACDSTNNPEPNPHLTTSSGPGGGPASSTGTDGTGGFGGGGATGTGGAGGGAGGGGGNCDGPNGCYDCPPHSNDQFLNHCTTAQCAPFDNEARLPLYNGGNLPPLP
jgi:hypothetical protein